MPIYNYKGVDKTGKDISGSVTTESSALAKQKIKSMGIMLLNIEEQKSDTIKKNSSIGIVSKISVTDLALMTRQFATLIKAKIQIVEALSALIDQAEKPQMKIILSEIKQKVNEGSSLSAAFSEYPQVFDNIYINMVDAGESSGTLEIVLLRLAEFTENQMKLRTKVKSALTYPVIMSIVGTVMIGIIFAVVIPKITQIFASTKKELPFQTQVCIWISDAVLNYWWLLIILIIGGYYFFNQYTSSDNGRKVWDAFVLKIPVIGRLLIMINVGRFCATLATLLNAGVPILTSIKIVKNLVSNVHMQKAIEEAKEAVAEGSSMTGPLAKSNLFPPMMIHMIKLGEKSGEIEPMLQIVSDNYEDEVNARLGNLSSLIEPLMLVVMGLVVAFVVYSIIVPIMEMSSLR